MRIPATTSQETRLPGARESLRAVRTGRAVRLYVAADAAPMTVAPVEEAARAAGVPVETVVSMRELGRSCGIRVDCACAVQVRKNTDKAAEIGGPFVSGS